MANQYTTLYVSLTATRAERRRRRHARAMVRVASRCVTGTWWLRCLWTAAGTAVVAAALVAIAHGGG